MNESGLIDEYLASMPSDECLAIGANSYTAAELRVQYQQQTPDGLRFAQMVLDGHQHEAESRRSRRGEQ